MKKLIPLIALALMCGTAIAADKDKPTRETTATFEALDQDGDQRISKAEASDDQNVSARFASLDANGDGALTKREFMERAKSDWRTTPKPPTREPYR